MPKAKYAEIYKDLKRKIETGEYEFQELLPSENTLVQEYDCSRNTIRRAIGDLVADGYVQTMQGKGYELSSSPYYRPHLPSAQLKRLRNLQREITKKPKLK